MILKQPLWVGILWLLSVWLQSFNVRWRFSVNQWVPNGIQWQQFVSRSVDIFMGEIYSLLEENEIVKFRIKVNVAFSVVKQQKRYLKCLWWRDDEWDLIYDKTAALKKVFINSWINFTFALNESSVVNIKGEEKHCRLYFFFLINFSNIYNHDIWWSLCYVMQSVEISRNEL